MPSFLVVVTVGLVILGLVGTLALVPRWWLRWLKWHGGFVADVVVSEWYVDEGCVILLSIDVPEATVIIVLSRLVIFLLSFLL